MNENTSAVKGDSMRALTLALATAAAAADVESALSAISAGAWTALGDPAAHERPGALKPGEHQFAVSGYFMLTPDGTETVLVAEHGFPPEQHRLRIASDLAHPGWVVKNRKPLLLANTDEDKDFKQILKTARMGSAMYSPLIWGGNFIGLLITASQARNTYDESDHTGHQAFANAAAAVYMAHDGPDFTKAL
ncbi:MAG: GAF domain-containing protein [Alphaproteobacteria bacterium]|nr:GAF domain-containing protein [Alphaproteobacteria bacterium]